MVMDLPCHVLLTPLRSTLSVPGPPEMIDTFLPMLVFWPMKTGHTSTMVQLRPISTSSPILMLYPYSQSNGVSITVPGPSEPTVLSLAAMPAVGAGAKTFLRFFQRAVWPVWPPKRALLKGGGGFLQ